MTCYLLEFIHETIRKPQWIVKLSGGNCEIHTVRQLIRPRREGRPEISSLQKLKPTFSPRSSIISPFMPSNEMQIINRYKELQRISLKVQVCGHQVRKKPYRIKKRKRRWRRRRKRRRRRRITEENVLSTVLSVSSPMTRRWTTTTSATARSVHA